MATKRNLKIVVDGVTVATKRTGRDYKGAIVGKITVNRWHRTSNDDGLSFGPEKFGPVTVYVLCRWVKNDGDKTKDHIAKVVARKKLHDVVYVAAA